MVLGAWESDGNEGQAMSFDKFDIWVLWGKYIKLINLTIFLNLSKLVNTPIFPNGGSNK